jgi:hypothetical protein
VIRQRFECLEENYASAFGECLGSIAERIKRGDISPPSYIAIGSVERDAKSVRACLILEGSEWLKPPGESPLSSQEGEK